MPDHLIDVQADSLLLEVAVIAVAGVSSLQVGAVAVDTGVANQALRAVSGVSFAGKESYLVQIEAGESIKRVTRLTEALVAARIIDTLSDLPTRTDLRLTLVDVLTERVAGVSRVTGAGVGALQVAAVSLSTDVRHKTLVNIRAGRVVSL